jgi:hypothetical protein
MKKFKYKIVKTDEIIEGNTYCEVLEEYRKATGDNRTYKDFFEKFPENVALITETNQNFSSNEEFECFLVVSHLIILNIICKL